MMRNITFPTRRARTSCSVLAIATALVVGPTPAIAAGSFQGTGTVTTGSATISAGATTTDITVTTPQTVIRWDPTDTAIGGGSINFQPANTTATFSGSGNYAVLNRIIPTDQTRAISLNGTINTSAPVGLPGASNGSLYFYAPGGFVIGSGAAINVGSLVLSASPITQDGSGNFINGLGTVNQVVFGQAGQPGAAITTIAGSQITASSSDAYVALVAPNITHNGAITVSGSAALVAAEAATINFSTDGLFDIQVDAGTTSSYGIATTGDIGGSASTGSGDNRRIFMVAVPKNQALTMVISSGTDLGFAIAGAANVDGNAIVLSAGHDIVDGAASSTASLANGTGRASISSNNLNTTSALFGIATKDLFVGATGTATLASDVTLKAVDNLNFLANGASALLTVKGNVSLSVDKTIAAGATGAGGIVGFYTNGGGRLIAEKNVSASANVTGADSATAGISGGNATGGSVRVQSQTGQLTILGDLLMSAQGIGGSALAAGVAGGQGTGGAIQFMTFFDTASKVAVTGGAFANAAGIGGSSRAGAAGGTGTGGTVTIGAQSTDAQLTVGGPLSVNADGQGGFADGAGVNGGFGRGGYIYVQSSSAGARTTLNGGVDLSASGFGGDSGGEGCPACNATGGAGAGGVIQLSTATGSATTTLTVNGAATARADGRGGFGIAGGGTGTGGTTTSTFAAGTAILLNGNVAFSALGNGGDSADGDGGGGGGGRVALGSQTGAVNGSLTVTGGVIADVSGYGGGAYGSGKGGAGIGGLTDNGGDSGTIDFQGNFAGLAIGQGGYSELGTGGNAFGGNGWVDAFGATIHIGGNYTMDTSADGGSGATGGNGSGGNAYLAASNTLTLDGTALLNSNGTGGSGYSGTGGRGTGGLSNVRATNGATLLAKSGVTATANGYGGSGGGKGTGGLVDIQAFAGGTLNISGALSGQASGFGGASYFGAASSGAGLGGTARIFTAGGSSMTIGGLAQLEADGIGGGNVEASGDGGLGNGGSADVYSGGGAITFNDDLTLSASARGGDTGSGAGGAALGGSAGVGSNGGAILVTGNLQLSGTASGGSGSSGGSATAIVSPPGDEEALVAVRLLARNGGSLTVNGQTNLDGHATGGSGFYGNGGNAIGGEADVAPFVGNITLADLSADLSGRGGNGGLGGDGGSGQGGAADIVFGLGDAAINGTIKLASATISADGYGGNGGNGTNADFGGNGGAGGSGTGGTISFTGSAAGGMLDSGPAILTARGTGGQGGAGGNGDSGTGGNGGVGGNGSSDRIQTGTVSNSGSPGSGGGVAYTSLSIDTSATGGNGGNGGSGGGGSGAGGDGGDAAGGVSSFLIRGVLATAKSVTLTANATGGNGGAGGIGGLAAIQGNGGNARTGIITVESKDRFEFPGQRGTLNAGTIVGTASAIGGSGATNGTSTVVDGSFFRLINGDATIDSVSITLAGNLTDSTFGPSYVSVRDGQAAIGSFSFVTSGTLALDANNGNMTANSIKLHAANFVPHIANPAPTIIGTYFANSFDIQTGNNFFTTANLDSVAALTINAPGSITIGNVTGDNSVTLKATAGLIDIDNLLAAGAIALNAGTSIKTGTIDNSGNTTVGAGTTIDIGALHSGNGAVSLLAGSNIGGSIVDAGSISASSNGNITLSDLDAGNNIFLRATGTLTANDANAGGYIDARSGGVMALGDLDAGDYIDLRSSNAIGLLTAIAGQTINFQTLGSLTGLSLTAGNSVLGEAMGPIQFGAITAGITNPSAAPGAVYRVGLSSNGNITTGAINTLGHIGFGTPANLVTGDLTSGGGIMALVGGNMSLGAITTGSNSRYVYLGNYSMSPLGGPFLTFNRAPILALFPVATGGSITINGPVSTGVFRAAAGTTFNAGNITANTRILIDSGGNMTLGNLNAGLSGDISDTDAIALDSGGNIAMGNAIAKGGIDFDAGGSVTGGNLTSGLEIGGSGELAVVLGNLSAGIVNPQGPTEDGFSIGVKSGISIAVGNVIGAESVGFLSLGSITTGSIDTGRDFLAMAGDNMSFGAIDAVGRVYLANSSMYFDAGGNTDSADEFNAELVFAATPVASGGSITAGIIDAGKLDAAAGGNFIAGAITTDDNIYIEADGGITTGLLDAGLSSDAFTDQAIRLFAGGSILIGNATALGGIDFSSGGSVTGGTLTSGIKAGGDAVGAIKFGNVSAGIVNSQGPTEEGISVGMASQTSIELGNVTGAEGVAFLSNGTLKTGTINAGTYFLGLAHGNMDLGAISANGTVYLADSSMLDPGEDAQPETVLGLTPVATGGAIVVGGPITGSAVIAAAGTTLTTGTIDADGRVALSSGGAMQTQDVTAGSSLRMTSGGTINGGDLTAGTLVRVSGAGAVNVGNIIIDNVQSEGFTTQDVGSGSPVEVFGASIATGDITTDGYVGLYTPGSLTVGTVNAGHDIIALVGTNASFTAVHTPERFLLGGYGMFAALNGGESFNPAAAFSTPKLKTGGSGTFAAASSANSFQAYVGTDLTAKAVNAQLINAVAGGTATVDGAWTAPSITLASRDINITANGTINGGQNGLVTLNAVSTQGDALIGDGLTGTGYALSNAEFGRVSGGNIRIIVGGSGGNANTLVGNLTINQSNIKSSTGGLTIATLNEAGTDFDGTLRVVGSVTATGFGADNYLSFATEHFELDAATGLISITGNGGGLSGLLELTATDIYVASGAILSKLEANPKYSGYIAELNAPAAVQRPDGVIRAAAIDLEGGTQGLRAVLVQNTGTAATPAGFLVNQANIADDGDQDAPAGSIDLVINGQIVGEGGTITGIPARDLLVGEFGTAPFFATSTINGCQLVGSCAVAPPKVETVKPTDVQLTGDAGLGDGLFGNEGDIDDGQSGDGGDLSSPISPPVPLFDSRPLTQTGDVDDPVSGAGNPSLYGNPDEDDAAAGSCSASKDKKCQVGTKGDVK